MSANEINLAATFQNRYKNKDTQRSRFITVIIEQAKNVEPIAYQVSDQCVAMIRDKVIEYSTDPYMFIGRQPTNKNELTPAIVYKNNSILPGEEIVPDEFLVKLAIMTNTNTLFKYHDLSSQLNDIEIRSHLATEINKPLIHQLSSLPLLVALSKKIDRNLIRMICKAIKQHKNLPANINSQIKQALKQVNLI